MREDDPRPPRPVSDAGSDAASPGSRGSGGSQPPSPGGAAAPEPSLAARIARSAVEGEMVFDDSGDRGEALERSSMGPDEAAGQELAEGSPAAPTSGRVDAPGATLGRHAGEVGSFAAGEGISSVGAPQGNTPESGVASRPGAARPETEPGTPERKAGFLEGQGGRRGVAVTEGQTYDDMGGEIRTAADAARASGDGDAEGRAGDGDPEGRAG